MATLPTVPGTRETTSEAVQSGITQSVLSELFVRKAVRSAIKAGECAKEVAPAECWDKTTGHIR